MIAVVAETVLLAVILLIAPIARAETGIASVYSGKYWEGGSKTANGERVRASALTAAHRTLSFGACVRVTNRANGRAVVVRINDRGPYVKGRVIDLTPAGARAIGSGGLARVNLARVPCLSPGPVK